MDKQIGKIERKSRSQTGSFLFGTFIGILLGIGAIFGIVAFAYFKVSPNWINKTFKTDISLGNEDLDGLTLNKLVNHAIGLAQNIDNYTLNDLKDDFGIDVGNEIIGIDITDLKDVALPDLMDAVQDKLGNISAYELRNVFEFGDLEDILTTKTATYYFDSSDKDEDGNPDNKLYKDELHNTEVGFKYSYNSIDSMIVVQDIYFEVETNNEVYITLEYLPLTDALGSYMTNIGDNTTIGELKGLGVTLPAFLDQDKYLDRKVNDLGAIIEEMTIADFFGTASTGALSLISADTKLTEVPTALSTALETKTIDDFITAGLVEKPEDYNDTTKNNWIVVNGAAKQIKNLTLQDVVDVFFDYVDISVLPSTQPTV